jgi:hypothetical protein
VVGAASSTEAPAPVDDRAPARCVVRRGEDRTRVLHKRIDDLRVELLAAALPRHPRRARDAVDAIRDLDVLSELCDARGQRHQIALQVAGPPAPVPPLVRRSDPVAHGVGKPELLAEHPRNLGVRLDHPVDLTTSGEHELEAEPEAVERRVPAAECWSLVAAMRRLRGSWSNLIAFDAKSSRTISPARARRSGTRR